MSQLQEDTRQTVLERDGRRCQFCGVTEEQHKDEKGRSLDIHHIIPRRAGGSDDTKNLISVCVGCHRTLEATQANALERIKKNEFDKGNGDEIETIKEELDGMKENWVDEIDAHSDTLTAVEELAEESIRVTVHIVHETRFKTSRVLYVGMDEERAMEKYKKSENHVTMETASVTVDDWLEQFKSSVANDIISDTDLRPTFEENNSIELCDTDD